MSRLKVWEAVRNFAQITEEQARALCQEFIEATDCEASMNIDDFVDDTTQHIEFVEYMHDICSRSSYYGIDLSMDPNVPPSDPFYYSRKVELLDINSYIISAEADSSYYCTICGDNYNQGGVRLSCENKNNCCTFCRDCIVPWITENVAKCPNCSCYLSAVSVPVPAATISCITLQST
jgi:hypothetical protein